MSNKNYEPSVTSTTSLISKRRSDSSSSNSRRVYLSNIQSKFGFTPKADKPRSTWPPSQSPTSSNTKDYDQAAFGEPASRFGSSGEASAKNPTPEGGKDYEAAFGALVSGLGFGGGTPVKNPTKKQA